MKKLLLTLVAFAAMTINVNAQTTIYNGATGKSYVDRNTLDQRAEKYNSVINDQSYDVTLKWKDGKKAWFGLGGSFLAWYDEAITKSEEKILEEEGRKKEPVYNDNSTNISTKKKKKSNKSYSDN
ncbi:MAG: hypothetical protein IKQ12_08790 [Prevotella sp.]|jgi:hypothetical protein|nr:hypothetical protein [Prevotella sp.]MBR4926302.1 hypothetical protein [Prevotella sp.]MBR6139642.1 hypothetical protein [Prevotella sp.]MDO4981651.1 hypothetical protein [Prevotellaceae bacterium]